MQARQGIDEHELHLLFQMEKEHKREIEKEEEILKNVYVFWTLYPATHQVLWHAMHLALFITL